ncbi:MAG: hypothetical protein NVS3B16_25480 [Vulcanimicrobiaceae bacterium]
MQTLATGFARAGRSEITFDGTVTSAPHFFYGTRTHAMHEAFDVRGDDGRTVEVVDNVALAPRIPVVVGDRVAVRGELIAEAKPEPVVHWTHHDPSGRHPDGYIVLDGRRYA